MRWLFVSLSFLWSSGLFASADALVARSRALHLGNSPQWKKILYYSTRWFGPDRSLVPQGKFFFSPRGDVDPQLELEATLTALLNGKDDLQLNVVPPVSHHAQCTFPARYQWLREKLPFPDDAPVMPCARLNEFLNDIDTDRVSLVFSTGYLGNAASLFGHTLFRFHRKSRGSALLDHAVGFAATIDTKNPFLYAWRGAAGGFPGMFNVLPYYGKIQEYNNKESRDLWEYELGLRPEQVQLMVKSVWEVGRYPMPYFYLDVNCASILFVLLDITDSKFHFAEDIAMWVTPTDVARSIGDTPGLVTATRYWPSSLTRYLSRFEMLQIGEKSAVTELLKDNWFLVNGLSSHQRARVIDTVLDFIDYSEKEEAVSVKYASLRNRLLLGRSRIAESPETIPEPDAKDNPASSHGSVRIAAGPQVDRFGAGLGINWRPALHDVLGAGNGYSGDLEIRFMDLDFRVLPGGAHLSRLGLLDIVSLNPKKPHLLPFSWRLGFLMDEDGGILDDRSYRNFRKYIRVAFGFSARPLRNLLVYGMPLIDAGHSEYLNQGYHVGAGLQTGILWSPLNNIRFALNVVGERRFGVVSFDDLNATLNGAVTTSQDGELRLENGWGLNGYRVMLSYSHYFWHFN